jgi:hypothetical protein
VIIIARLGGVELIADDERTDQTPTPEWIEDTAKRVSRVALETYLALPEGVKVQPVADEDDD